MKNERLVELVEEAVQNKVAMSSDGWQKVNEFIYNNDHRNYLFVMN